MDTINIAVVVAMQNVQSQDEHIQTNGEKI